MNSIKKLLKQYFSSLAYFYRYLRYRIFLMVGLSILIGLLDGIGLTMFLPLLQMADGSETVSSESLGDLSFVMDGLNGLGFDLTLKSVIFLLLFFFLLKGCIVYIASIVKVRINQYFISNLRINLTDLLARFSYKTFVKSDVGRIQNSLTGEISRVTNAYKFYSDCMQQFVMVAVYTVFVFMVDWKFALLVCIGGGLTNLVYGSIYKKTKEQSAELTKNSSGYQGQIIQFIANFKYLKATGYLTRYTHKLKERIRAIETNNKKIGFLNAKITASREPMLITVVCVVILIQVQVLGGQIAPIMLSLLFFYRALTSLMLFQNNYNSFLALSGSLDNITEFEQELRESKEQDGTVKISGLTSAIELRHVDFGYSANDLILKDISLSIKKNQTVAFVGESGSGKTTLVNLISGLFMPDRGTVQVDGVEFRDMNRRSFQSRLGYIAQDPVIFNDTIFNNVTFWDDPTAENKQRFDYALQQASISDFVEGLSKKGDTRLGNNGINLSGGQKQRISIARELYKEIDIILLDEATSALDSETEQHIQTNIDNLKGQYTILIIAHRLSTIKNADVIYLMDKGAIVGQGSFDELIRSSERFQKMVELQEI